MLRGKSVLLAYNKPIKFKDLTYPLLGSPKYDGNRLLIVYGELLSRKMKKQPNRHLGDFLQKIRDYSRDNRVVFDGEFFSTDCHFTEIQSMRAHDWKPLEHFAYHVFDMLTKDEWEGEVEGQPFRVRAKRYGRTILNLGFPHVIAVPQAPIFSPASASQFYQECLSANFEGAILRDPEGGYKRGRSGKRDGLMYKFKEMATVDARIIGFEQRERMTDEYKASERGRNEDGSIERTSRQATRELVPDVIGATTVRLKNGTTCNVCLKRGVSYESLGISWAKRKRYIGKWVEIEYQEAGTKDRPRMGRIVRLRPDLD